MENQKLKELLMNLMNSLTDEQKEKAKTCKDLNELTVLLGEMGVPLPDELLDHVAGGWSEEDEDDPEYIRLWAEFTKELERRVVAAGIDAHNIDGEYAIRKALSDEWTAQGKWGRFQDWIVPPQ